jgi:enterobactin synthetase component D
MSLLSSLGLSLDPLEIRQPGLAIQRGQFLPLDSPSELWEELLPEHLLGAALGRKREFLAGRCCAALALRELTPTGWNPYLIQDHQPPWPRGYWGSITHTRRGVAGVGISTSCYKWVGLDREEILLSFERAQKLALRIINQDEARILDGGFLTYEEGITLIFSAKESLFKALYPAVKKKFYFHEAHLTSLTPQTLTLRHGLFGQAETIELSYQIRDGHVETLCLT